MFHSIFRKQAAMYLITLILSFLLLSVALGRIFESYFTKQRRALLIEQGEKIALIVERAYIMGQPGRIVLSIQNEINSLHTFLNASFLYVNVNFNVLMYSEDIGSIESGMKINTDELKNVMDGEVVWTVGKLGGVFNAPMMTVAYPVTVNGTVIGALFMSSSMPELKKTVYDFYRIMIACLIITMLVTTLLVYMSWRTLSRPLYKINDAAKVIANGDFHKRIDVKGNDEVGELVASFNHMAESLDVQEQMRREFIANISHDLRSPLTSMRGFLEAIADGTIPPERQNHYIGIVLDETQRLTKLTNDILDLSNLQSADIKLERTDFDINELLRRTLLTFEHKITAHGINVSINLADEQNFVNADYEKIQRVVFNLLDNAVKFTKENGNIGIETVVRDRKVYVSVKDDGIGIDDDEKDRIFDRFFKTDLSRGEHKDGSGLGLSIVKGFIMAHGETISVDSRKGEGSTFTFSLTISEKFTV